MGNRASARPGHGGQAAEARGWSYDGRWAVGSAAAGGAFAALTLAGCAALGVYVAPSGAWALLAGAALAAVAGLVYARVFRP